MDCTAYRTRTDHLLLVPDCMVATMEAERRFGPLRKCGTLDTDVLPAPLQERVERDFEARSYHRLADTFARKFGLAAPTQPQARPRRRAGGRESAGPRSDEDRRVAEEPRQRAGGFQEAGPLRPQPQSR